MSNDKIVKALVEEKVKDMTIEELMIAIEEQNNGLYRSLQEIVLSQIDVIKEQQKEILNNREMIKSLVNTVNQVKAQTEIVIQKQSDLESFALIATGLKSVGDTKIGREEIIKKATEYVDKQEEQEIIDKAKKKEDKINGKENEAK